MIQPYGRRMWLAAARMRAGYTQESLATKCCTTVSMIQQIEYGTKTPSLRLGIAIADAVEVHPRMFVTRDDESA